MYIVSVPTPYDKLTKKIDPSYLVSAIDSILDVCLSGSVIIIESTISPGTIERRIKPQIAGRGFLTGRDVHLVHAPERILPGNMLQELVTNSRTIGAEDYDIGLRVKNIYASFCKGEIVVTDIKSAEMSKVVENTFRDINIAFANELAKICHANDIDVYEIISLANRHPRVNILQPGPGVGGHCIPIDPWFLVGDNPDIVDLILAARRVNDNMPAYVFYRIKEIMAQEGIADYGRVGLYGLTYKENVDDTRESPTLQLLAHASQQGVDNFRVYDPWVKQDLVEGQYHSFSDFVRDIDLMVLMVGHEDIKNNCNLLEGKIIYDTKRVLKNGLYTIVYL